MTQSEQYQLCLSGELTAAVLIGEPGVGETRLASAVTERLHDLGVTVLIGRCEEQATAALQPIAEWLDFVMAHCEPAELAQHLGAGVRHLSRLAPELAERIPGLEGELWPTLSQRSVSFVSGGCAVAFGDVG